MQVTVAGPDSAITPLWARPEIPDPCRPACLHRYGAMRAQPGGKRWHSHQERRSQILAAARRLLTDRGLDGVCFRAIADLCEISVPTIYNVVGDRGRVMNDASAEWVQWVALAAASRAAGGSPALTVLEAFWASGPDHPQFTANAVKDTFFPQSRIGEAFHNTGYGLIRDMLRELRAGERLRPHVSIDRLAWHLTRSTHAGIANWSLHPYDRAEFRAEFADGPGLMFLGAVQGAEIKTVERTLEQIRQRWSTKGDGYEGQ